MVITPTELDGVFLITPEPRRDERGYFARTFCKDELGKAGIAFDIMQINRSLTRRRGTLRGLHVQRAPKAEGKIIECVRGAVFDVVVDIREDSPNFGKWLGVELNKENAKILYVPEGFAHGFQTLTDEAEIQYLMSEFYSPEHATGVRWDDPFFGISWPIMPPAGMSDKDRAWPLVTRNS